MKRFLCVVLALAVSLVFCSCKAAKPAAEAEPETIPETVETAVTEAEPETQAETGEEETEAIVDEEVNAVDVQQFGGNILAVDITVNSMGTNDEGYEHQLASVRYPGYSLSPECAEAFPELQKTLEKDTKDYADNAKNVLTELTSYAEEAIEEGHYYSENIDYIDPEIRRADTTVLSIFRSYENYSGGVHGYYAYGGDNYDVQSGKKLTLADVIVNMDSFKATVTEKISAQYPDVELYLVDELFADYDGTDDAALPWCMDYLGITVYFNPYVIGSYAQGAQIINLPFTEGEGLFDKRFMNTPDRYVQQLNAEDWAWIDDDGDGAIDCVYVDYEYDEYDPEAEYNSDYKTYRVNFKGKTLELGGYNYSGEFYLVHANDQYYVYAFETSDNDYSMLCVADLKTMTCDMDKAFNAYLPGSFGNYDSTDTGYQSSSTTRAFTDPDYMAISSTLDALGTMGGQKVYHVGSDGWPVSDSEYYDVKSYFALTPYENVPCAEGELEKGKFYQIVRTDNKSWVELQEIDRSLIEEYGDDDYKTYSTEIAAEFDPGKTVYRLEYDCTSWPKIINGKEESEIFSGIMYAG